VILTVSILTGQTKAFHTHTVLWAVPHQLTLTVITTGFDAEVLTGGMPLLSCCHPTDSVKVLRSDNNKGPFQKYVTFFSGLFDSPSPSVTQCHTFDYPQQKITSH